MFNLRIEQCNCESDERRADATKPRERGHLARFGEAIFDSRNLIAGLADYVSERARCPRSRALTHSGLQFVPLVLIALLLLCCPVQCAPAKKGDIKRGAELFDKNTCSQCHLNGSNMIEPTKPLKGPGFAKKYPRDEQIAAIVRKGAPGTGMPSTGKDMLSDPELCDIIAYIRSLTPATACAPAIQKKAAVKQAPPQPSSKH